MLLAAPAIDVSSVYGLIFLNKMHVAEFWLGFLALQALAAGYSLRVDREPMRALWVLRSGVFADPEQRAPSQ